VSPENLCSNEDEIKEDEQHGMYLVWTPELVFVGMYMPSFPGFLVKLMGMQERTSIRKRKNK
jgi:hypothetical protein